MNELIVTILLVSIILQFLAALMAIRLIRITGRLVAWILLSCGFILQGVRRVLTLSLIVHGEARGDLSVELVTLAVSAFMLAGISLIGPLFSKMKETHEEILRKNDELARAHRELVESETRYRTVAEFTSDWECWLAPDNTFKFVSPSCEEMSGYTAEEFYSDPQLILRIIHPEDLPLYQNHLHVRTPEGKPRPIDFRIITRSGETRWISHVCRPVTDTDGTPLGSRGSNRDITARKEMEHLFQEHAVRLAAEVVERQVAQEALAVKQLQLEGLNRTLEERIEKAVAELREKDQMIIVQSRHAAMGEMIDYIAHQWKSPLNNLSLIMQSISNEHQGEPLAPDEIPFYLGKGEELVNYMSQTIDDFRCFFREDREKRFFSARESVARVVSLMEASMKDNDIRVVVEPGEDLQIEGYRNEYAQVLLNLVANAREALLERKVTDPVIRIRLFGEEGRAVVTVSDNAGGIPDAFLGKIFDPYFTTKKEGKGSGLGLFMAKTIIEKHLGGRVAARNTGAGAEFRVEV